ncbi:metallocarboxypeptidase inhibitor-like [Lycium barbarum]|uniref:metallocarboxypeptidase inhibitor-like n=1 Tax=Lycium barbarum TaxID=112863 RepID=UPI00293E2312|nr:metallocarboxypeptidase inhibitor-like [Lycium barbarum]
MAEKGFSHTLAIIFTALLVVIAAHSFCSAKIHVMAQEDVLPIAKKLFQDDPTCGKPCNTMDDCSNGWFCQACWNFRKTCGPFVGDAIAMGM